MHKIAYYEGSSLHNVSTHILEISYTPVLVSSVLVAVGGVGCGWPLVIMAEERVGKDSVPLSEVTSELVAGKDSLSEVTGELVAGKDSAPLSEMTGELVAGSLSVFGIVDVCSVAVCRVEDGFIVEDI